MSDEMKKKEEAVFRQEVNEEELGKVSGGASDSFNEDCTRVDKRDIYKGGFPNCAATVESGSWCVSNDACGSMEVDYYNMENCFLANCNKAWK